MSNFEYFYLNFASSRCWSLNQLSGMRPRIKQQNSEGKIEIPDISKNWAEREVRAQKISSFWVWRVDIEYCGNPSSCTAVIVEAGELKPKQHITKDCRRGMSTFGQSSHKNWNNYNYDSGVLFYWLASCLGFIFLINRTADCRLFPGQLKSKYFIFYQNINILQLTPTVSHVSWPLWYQEWRLDMKF